jgi:DNA-binding transcriptional LysR family regulator
MRIVSFGHLADLEVFCRAAELGHFAAAAEQLALPPSSVSRAIQRLESRLGVALFTRTTRKVALTEEGAFFFREARQALQQIEDAEFSVGGAHRRAVGKMRIAVPTSYGHVRILPRVPAFLALHPYLELEIHVTNRDFDVVEDGFDLAIRLGQQPASSLISRTIEHGRIGIFASPSYLAHAPPLGTLADLVRHRCIGFVYPGVRLAMEWEFLAEGAHTKVVAANSTIIVSDPIGLVTLALADGGLIQTGHYLVEDYLRSGKLVEVLTPWAGVTRPIVALYPANRRGSAKLRAFVDFFTPGR